MSKSKRSFATLEELRSFVAETLGNIESLKSERFPLTEDVLFRSGRPCGIYFCLHGPRQVRLSAVWETDANRILFYGSCGRRVQCTHVDSLVVESPEGLPYLCGAAKAARSIPQPD